MKKKNQLLKRRKINEEKIKTKLIIAYYNRQQLGKNKTNYLLEIKKKNKNLKIKQSFAVEKEAFKR